MSDINYYASIAKIPSVKFLKNAYDVTLAPDAASTFAAARSFFLPNNVAANTYLLGASGAALTAAKLPKTATNGLIEASGIGIDSSSNLTSVGTIESGKITSSTADIKLGAYTVTAVATGNLLTSATAVAAFATSVTSPIIYGGSGDDADLTLESSSGTPSATSYINFGASGAAGQINRNTNAWTIPVSLTLGTASTPSGYTPSVLDSYQHEGSWTPTDASGASLSLTVANCHFTRIGRLCICYCQISYPDTANGSAALIGGLPFTSKNDSGGTGCGFVGYTNLGQEVSALVTANATTFGFYGTSAGLTNANMALKQVRLCIIYPIKT